MSDNTEDHTIRLLQEMRAEVQETRVEMREMRTGVRAGFESMSTRMDGMTHILVMLAAELHRHEERIEKLEHRAE